MKLSGGKRARIGDKHRITRSYHSSPMKLLRDRGFLSISSREGWELKKLPRILLGRVFSLSPRDGRSDLRGLVAIGE